MLVNMKHVLHDDTHLIHYLSVDHLIMALPFNSIRNRSPSYTAYRSQQRVSYSHMLICHHKNNKLLHSWIWCVELLLPIQPWDSCNDRLFLKKKKTIITKYFLYLLLQSPIIYPSLTILSSNHDFTFT